MDSPAPSNSSAVSAPALSRWRRRKPLTLTAFAGVALSVALFIFVRTTGWERMQPEFARRADVPATALQRDIDDHVNQLRSISAFYYSSQDVDRREFAGFVSDALVRLKGVMAVEWIPRVADANRPAHEAS